LLPALSAVGTLDVTVAGIVLRQPKPESGRRGRVLCSTQFEFDRTEERRYNGNDFMITFPQTVVRCPMPVLVVREA
jgi:cell fate regulator YaaT (PSP1 superfamily)